MSEPNAGGSRVKGVQSSPPATCSACNGCPCSSCREHDSVIASLRAERDQLDKDVMTAMGTIQKIVAERDELLELVRTAKNWFENEYPSPSPQWTFRASSALQRGKV